MLVYANFPVFNNLSQTFHTFENAQNLMNYDVLLEDFSNKLRILSLSLEDLINSLIFNQKESFRTFYDRILSYFSLRKLINEVNTKARLGNLIILIISDVFRQGKNHREIFLRKNTRKIFENMVFY